MILKAIQSLVADGQHPPFATNAVGLVAVDVLGAPHEVIREYLRAMELAVAGVEIGAILGKVRSKQALIELINEASTMLGKGVLDVGLLTSVITRDAGVSDIRPLTEELKDGFPDPPEGLSIDSLPALTEAVGGLYGMWAISGEPGVGKSGLGWQITLDLGRKLPAIYYDFENGLSVLLERTRSMVSGNLERARNLVRNVYYRNSIRTLDADLASVPAPALIVVDSIQKLPGSIEHKRASLDRWVHRLEYLKKRGYHVIAISEIPRSQYQQDAYIGAFKESGEVEYSADTGIQLLPAKEGSVEVHIVKNRHRPRKGYVAMLGRVGGGWLFKELGGD